MNYKIDIRDLVPENKVGSKNNASAFFICQSETDALDRFLKLSNDLLNINKWNIKSGENPTEFYTYHKNKSELAKEKDLVKMKIPAPVNKLGNGFDWVMIAKIEKVEKTDIKALLLQMTPHSCPDNSNGQTAHFYTEDATNTFILAKKNNILQLSIHGRNEIPNTKKIGILHSLRNFFVAHGGVFGGSKIQWQDFAEEFIKN